MGRMKDKAMTPPKPRNHPSLPTKDPYYPEGSEGYEVIDNRCTNILTEKEQAVLSELLLKIRSEYTTRALSQYIEQLEAKISNGSST